MIDAAANQEENQREINGEGKQRGAINTVFEDPREYLLEETDTETILEEVGSRVYPRRHIFGTRRSGRNSQHSQSWADAP